MPKKLEDEIIAELTSKGQLSENLKVEINRALESERQKRHEKRLSLVRSQFSQKDSSNLFSRKLRRSGPPPPRSRFPQAVLGSPFLPFFRHVTSQTSNFLLGVPEQPVFGSITPIDLVVDNVPVGQNLTFHSFSELTRKSTGEVSVAAAVTDASAQPIGIVAATGSIVQMWVLPLLPAMGLSMLSATANISGSSLASSILSFATPNSAAATYGYATISLGSAIEGGGPRSSSVEFLRNESLDPGAQYSDLDDSGFITLFTNAKYDGNSVFVFTEVEIAVVCIVEDVESAQAVADLRFSDDNSLAVAPDFPIPADEMGFSAPVFYEPTILPPSSPLRVTLIQIDGR